MPEALAVITAQLATQPAQAIWLAGDECIAYVGLITASGAPGLGLAPALIITGETTARHWALAAAQRCNLLQLRGLLQLTYAPPDGCWRVTGGGAVLLGRPVAMAGSSAPAHPARFQIDIFTGGDHFAID